MRVSRLLHEAHLETYKTFVKRSYEVCCAGFRSTRRTKIICTIGPGSSSPEMLQTLAEQGMNVARLNMGHGTQDWHKTVIDRIRKLNLDKG